CVGPGFAWRKNGGYAGRLQRKRQPKLPFRMCGNDNVSGRGRGRLAAVALAELLDAPGRVHDLLLARVERMAGRAHFDVQRLVDRRARGERVATAAGDVDFG